MTQNVFIISEYGQREVTLYACESIRREDPKAGIFVGNDAFPFKGRPQKPAWINFLDWTKNVGYVKNINQTTERALMDYSDPDSILFICNNDIAFWKGSVSALSQYATEHDAVVGPTLTIPAHYQLIHPQFQHLGDPIRRGEPRPIRMLSGCCMVMKARIWLDIGGLDEDYLWYYTDDQLTIDAQKLGYPSIYLPEAVIDHNVGKTMRRNRAMMQMIREDKRIFISKNPDLEWSETGEWHAR